jgi:polyhydroxyalkanoate synthase
MAEPPRPLEVGMDAQRQVLESAVDFVEKATISPDRAGRASEVEVGTTPSETVYEENKLELLRYEPVVAEDERKETPILVVYALVNKPYILDLQPNRSVVRRLLEGGYDVYMIDWGEPGARPAPDPRRLHKQVHRQLR